MAKRPPPPPKDSDYEYFKSEVDRLCFLLIHCEGKARNDLLGIRRVHYADKKKAKLWYKSVALKIHPDRNPDHPKCGEAMEALNELFHHITY
tara:strand:+ start:185 stop:460 length:276 start_codon:yes stop_codon:yes gene_type:complete